MQSTVSILFLSLLLSLNNSALGFGSAYNSDINVKLTNFKSSNTYVMTLVMETSPEPLTISIKNSTGKTIFQEITKDVERVKKVYDLSSLPVGSYEFEFIQKQTVLRREKVIVKKCAVIRHPDIGKTVNVGFSSYNADNKTILFAVENKAKKQVYMKVYNKSGDMLFTKAIGNDAFLKHRCDLSSLRSGDYTLKVGNGNTVFSRKLTIN
ncbi:MAG: hypothetical protein AAFX87_28915 [Bacteroidota bacterium]